MTKTSSILAVAAVLVAGTWSEARAQAPVSPANQGFVNVNLGWQPQSRTITTAQTLPIFGETATITSNQPVHGGVVFDFGGGYKVWRNLAVGVNVSRFSRESDAAVVATIPNPLVFDQPATLNLTQAALGHSETGVHLQAVWFFPPIDNMDVSVSIGPSFIHVSQDLVRSATIDSAAQTVTLSSGNETGTAVGFNVGVDGNYFFNRNIGAGVYMRYAGGSVDLPSVPGLSVGGFQIGAGARFRF
jgi:hypothetical protein